MERKIYPFTAIVGQEEMKEALLLNIINPSLTYHLMNNLLLF